MRYKPLRLGVVIAAALLVASGADAQQASPPPALRLTLLGTAGGPPPHPDRAQPASLLQVDGTSYLIDAGEGVAQQALRAGVPPSRIDQLFITHLHWDHTLGLGYLMATGWMMGRSATLPIWGPPGLFDFVSKEEAAVAVGEDIFRPQMPGRPPLASLYYAREMRLTGPREIFRDAHVRVTAAATSHFAQTSQAPHAYGADQAYAYRFDTAHGSVTFTGDTGPSDAVTALARGSDVLVAEVCDFDSIRQALLATEQPAKLAALLAHMREEHLSPEAVAQMANAAGVKKVVLTHFVMGRGTDPEALAAKVRLLFKGEVVAGRDLMSFALAN